MSPFESLREYEQFIYTLPQYYSSIAHSTLIIVQRGRSFAELSGELTVVNQYRLVIYERLTWQDAPLAIVSYSYEAWRGSEKLFWYDSQPHPDDPILSSTEPHHMHVPPNIKHHRIPAPGLSFARPNLPGLISSVESLPQSA